MPKADSERELLDTRGLRVKVLVEDKLSHAFCMARVVTELQNEAPLLSSAHDESDKVWRVEALGRLTLNVATRQAMPLLQRESFAALNPLAGTMSADAKQNLTPLPIMKLFRNPNWWDTAYESSWERVKAAFRRDWDQTQHDLGRPLPNIQQSLPNTVAQAIGSAPIPPPGVPNYEDAEAGYRFGYGARRYYGKDVHEWNEEVEERLRRDWEELTAHPEESWERYRDAIKRGWNHKEG